MTDREIATQYVRLENVSGNYHVTFGGEVQNIRLSGFVDNGTAAIRHLERTRRVAVQMLGTLRKQLGSSPEARVLADLLADQGFTEAADWLQERFACPPTVAQEPYSLIDLLNRPEMYGDEAIERLRDRCTEIIRGRRTQPRILWESPP